MTPSASTVLFFTYPEHGQANVILATSYELALAGVDVTIASFLALKTRVTRLQDSIVHHKAVCSDTQPAGSVTFRECQGFPSFMECMEKQGVDISKAPHPAGVSGALKCYSNVHLNLFPWGVEEHVSAIENIKELVGTVKPDTVVIDGFFYLAMDACKLIGQKYIIILPNSIKDVTLYLQPRFSVLWKYPIMSSGFQFPLKWWQIPLNVYLYLRLAIKVKTNPRVKEIQTLRRSLGIQPTIVLEFQPGVTHICPAITETDFPLAIIPREMALCGPIVLPFDPLEESYPALKTWLDGGSTVVVNLGSHVLLDEARAKEMASAFRILIEYHDRKGRGRIQVLWKAKPNGNIQKAIEGIIGKEIEQERIKVVAWLDVEPVAILQHPGVVCTVHHGGANSFYEGIRSGLPHIVLPVWLDTYDYAARVEFLNIGIFGSKHSAPGARAEEFGSALVKVTGDTEEADAFRSSARRLQTLCQAKGEGRKLAAAAILQEIGITK